MNLPVKICMKRYDTHNKAHWTTVYRLLELSLVPYLVHPKIKFYISYWTKVVTGSNLTLLLIPFRKWAPGDFYPKVDWFERLVPQGKSRTGRQGISVFCRPVFVRRLIVHHMYFNPLLTLISKIKTVNESTVNYATLDLTPVTQQTPT